jgi:hypothetical protein
MMGFALLNPSYKIRSTRGVIASAAKQSRGLRENLDCFVALLLAMTNEVVL